MMTKMDIDCTNAILAKGNGMMRSVLQSKIYAIEMEVSGHLFLSTQGDGKLY